MELGGFSSLTLGHFLPLNEWLVLFSVRLFMYKLIFFPGCGGGFADGGEKQNARVRDFGAR